MVSTLSVRPSITPQRRHKRLLVTHAGAETLGKRVLPFCRTCRSARHRGGFAPWRRTSGGCSGMTLCLRLPWMRSWPCPSRRFWSPRADPEISGAVCVSAAAFGAAAVILPEHGAPDTTGALVRRIRGALELAPLVRVMESGAEVWINAKPSAVGRWALPARQTLSCPMSIFKGRSVLVLGAEGPKTSHPREMRLFGQAADGRTNRPS